MDDIMRLGHSSELPELKHLRSFAGTKGVRLIRLFDCLEDVQVWIKDRQGRYVWVNRAFLTNYAIKEDVPLAALDEVQGKTDHDLCPVYLADQYQADDELVLAGQAVANRIELVGQLDGGAAWSVTNKIPLQASNGAVIGTAGLTWRLREEDAAASPGAHLGAVLNHLRGHYRDPITNAQLAKLAGLSVRAFERKFLAAFHLPPQRYLRKLRLRLAGHALVFSHRSIVEVALDSGFADQSHFTREFRRHFGRTPREFRAWYARSPGVPITKSGVSNQ